MFVKVQRRNDVINVGDDVVTIDDVTDERLLGRVRYRFGQLKLLSDSQNLGSIVKVSFSIEDPKKQTSLKNAELYSAPTVIGTLYRDSIENSKIADSNIVEKLLMDSTSKVSNSLLALPTIARNKATQLRGRTLVLQTVANVRRGGGDVPLPNLVPTATMSGSIVPRIDLKNLLTIGTDASAVMTAQPAQQSVKAGFSGFPVSAPASTTRTLRDLAGKFINKKAPVPTSTIGLPSNTKILTVQSTLDDTRTVEADFDLSLESIKNPDRTFKTVFITFEVLDSGGVSAQIVEKKFDVTRGIQLFDTPKIPPTVSNYVSDSTLYGTIHVVQNDPRATSVKLYSRRVSHVSPEPEDFIYRGTFDLKMSDGETILPIEVSSGGSIVYRIVPVGRFGYESTEFASIVIPAAKPFRRFRYASLSSKTTIDGVTIEVRNLSPDTVSFDVLRKDRTLFENSFTIINNSPIPFESDSTTYIVNDFTKLKSGHVYEYACSLNHRAGLTETVGNILVEYVPATEGSIDTKVQNLRLEFSPTLDVKFDISTNLLGGSLDTVNQILDETGLSQYFSDDVKNERDRLKKLIAYQVERQDLTLGKIESFGVTSTTSFSDVELGPANFVEPIRAGRKYRYKITTLLRAPETLLEQFSKTVTDDVTKKTYQFKPFKFFHPSTLVDGALPATDGFTRHNPKSDFEFGDQGATTTVEISFDRNIVPITDVRAEQDFGRYIIVTWKYVGDLRDVDHFIVTREIHGARRIVGKAHALDGTKNVTFLREIDEDDLGGVTFYVTPVYSDFSVGTEVVSNLLPVQP